MSRSPGAPESLVIGGLRVNRFRAEGTPAGPPIVFVHGGMDRAAGFRRTARHLPDRELVAYDRRGYAGSIAMGAAVRFLDHVDDLRRVCDELDEPALLVGHSMGGLICLQALSGASPATLTTEAPVGAVLWEPPLSYEDWYPSPAMMTAGQTPDDLAETFMRWAIGDQLWERLPGKLRAERRAEGPAIISDMEGARERASTVNFEAISQHIIVGRGSESDARHQQSANEAAARLSHAHLEVVEGASHGVHLHQPQTFASIISSWGR